MRLSIRTLIAATAAFCAVSAWSLDSIYKFQRHDGEGWQVLCTASTGFNFRLTWNNEVHAARTADGEDAAKPLIFFTTVDRNPGGEPRPIEGAVHGRSCVTDTDGTRVCEPAMYEYPVTFQIVSAPGKPQFELWAQRWDDEWLTYNGWSSQMIVADWPDALLADDATIVWTRRGPVGYVAGKVHLTGTRQMMHRYRACVRQQINRLGGMLSTNSASVLWGPPSDRIDPVR